MIKGKISIQNAKFTKWSFHLSITSLAILAIASVPQIIKQANPQKTTANQPKYTAYYDPITATRAKVIYTSDSGKRYIWFDLQQLGKDWKPEERAFVISQRLEQLRYEKIKTLGWGKMNNQNIICVITEKTPECQQLVTLPPDISVESVLPLVKCKVESPDLCLPEIKSFLENRSIFSFMNSNKLVLVAQHFVGAERRLTRSVMI